MSQVSYKRVFGGKRSRHGSGVRVFRLNSRRFSVQGLRTRFFCLFRLLSRLKASYGRAVRLLKKGMQRKNGMMMMRRNNSSGSRRNLVVVKEVPATRLRSFGRSNSFYAEAIADCLEFIKRSSFSVEQIQDPVCHEK